MNTIDTGSGYGMYGRPIAVFEGYREWANYESGDPNNPGGVDVREAGTTSDFALYMDSVVRKVFYNRYQRAKSKWRQFAAPMSVVDYREVSSVSFEGLPTLSKVSESGEYKDTPLNEVEGPKVRVEKFGNLFSLTREIFINDDLGRLNNIPSMQAEAAHTSLAIDIVRNTLESPGNAYDGTAFFDNAHNNLGTDALAEASLAEAITAMRSQTDENGYRVDIEPSILVVPVDEQFTAARILNSTEVHIQGSGSTAEYGQGNFNVVRGIVDYVVEPYLTDSNDWYLFSSPDSDRPAFKVAFLNNMQEPQLFLRNPEVRAVMAANPDPYTMEFDEIWWKVRFEWGATPWEWRAAYKGAVA